MLTYQTTICSIEFSLFDCSHCCVVALTLNLISSVSNIYDNKVESNQIKTSIGMYTCKINNT